MKRSFFFALAAALCIGLSGCTMEEANTATEPTKPVSAQAPTVGEMSAERRLLISAVANENAGFTTIKPEQLGGNFDEDILYLDLTDVTITVDGIVYPLENAIRDGLISVEEIFAYARIDARKGICTETYTSEHGLAYFTYRYPEFDLRMTYDVYETPDGKTHLINDMGIFKVGSNVTSSYIDDETGIRIDREDWGIDFEVSSVTPTSLTINCIQSGGQQIGELEVFPHYLIYAVIDEQTSLLDSQGEAVVYTQDTLPSPIAKIERNGTTQFTIDWSERYGALESGLYRIKLNINDVFDQSQVHPLMQDYHTSQGYWIEFTIP